MKICPKQSGRDSELKCVNEPNDSALVAEVARAASEVLVTEARAATEVADGNGMFEMR